MRAALFNRYGGPDELYIGKVPMPKASATETLIRVEAASINGGEIAGRRGDLKLVTGRRFPKRTGIDFVGIVVDAGVDAAYAPVGSRVWGTVKAGGQQGAVAEYISIGAAHYGLAPKRLTAAEAATLVAGGTTALRALGDLARLRAGERLLVRGAAGGVGSVAVQLGKHLGAHVTGLAHPKTADFVRAHGADEVVDYATPPEHLGTYDVIFDTRGTELRTYRRQLTSKGRMITIIFDLSRPIRSVAYLLIARLSRSRPLRIFFGDPDRALLEEVAKLVEDGAIHPVLDAEMPFEQIATAHARLERGGVLGKVVVRIGDDR